MMRRLERLQLTVDGDDDQAVARERRAVVEVAGALREAAAVHPEGHRQLLRAGRRPDVEEQAVLAHRQLRAHQVLHADGAQRRRVRHAARGRPRRRLRRAEAVRPRRARRVAQPERLRRAVGQRVAAVRAQAADVEDALLCCRGGKEELEQQHLGGKLAHALLVRSRLAHSHKARH